MRLTDVNLHLRKLQILGLYGSEKKARGFPEIFRGTPRSARGRSAVAIAQFGTYDYKNYSKRKRGSPPLIMRQGFRTMGGEGRSRH
jgi:hypothetical protein